MTACEEFILRMQESLPELASTQDLIKLGIFGSDQAASAARRKKIGPEYFQMNGRVIRYPKNGVIEYLKKSQCSLKAS